MNRISQIAALGAITLATACSASDSEELAPQGKRGDSDDYGSSGDGDGDLNYAGTGGSTAGAAYEQPLDDLGAAGSSADQFEPVGTNPFVVVGHDPLSTFAADVDTASYDLFRSYVQNGVLPNRDSIRLEEFVNYFSYDYPAPDLDAEHPFSIHLAAAPSLSTRGTRLLRVGIQGKEIPPDTEKKPANLVFLVDVSGSMQGQMSMVQTTLRETVKLLDPSDTISIVTYASNPGTALSATPVSAEGKISAAIDALTSGGSTNGSGGINAAYAEAESAFIEGGINHVLICTDGDFNVGVTGTDSLEELIIEKRKTGITLTALGFGQGNYNDAMMERISNAGNGIYGYIGSDALAKKYVTERMLQTLVHIAKDMKIQVEFNPERVYAYRLLGYENRAIADNDFRNDVVDAGEIGSGHRVTALYELVFEESDMPMAAGAPAAEDGAIYSGEVEVDAADLVLVKVRYKTPDAKESDAAFEVAESLTPEEVHTGFENAASSLQWAAAVAAYAEILKESPYASNSALEAISQVLEAQADLDEDRKEFLALFQAANSLRE